MKAILKKLVKPQKDSRKGENGKLFIFAGSKKYHGAPAFCILGARRFCDLVYFMPGDDSPGVLHSVRRIPEAIIVEGFQPADAALYGPGLGSAPSSFDRLRINYPKMVVDGDGLGHLEKSDLKGLLITPHEGEFRRLFGKDGTRQNVARMAMEYGCTILKKGPVDIISDGKTTIESRGGNAGMTKGGTGDVLSGLAAALLTQNGPLVAACAASRIAKEAGDALFRANSFAFCASDLAEALPPAYKKIMR
ncbi:MAG: NAD(P)H-hydrate dehydratase [Candidatus Bilamarchaeaceae archaeon]